MQGDLFQQQGGDAAGRERGFRTTARICEKWVEGGSGSQAKTSEWEWWVVVVEEGLSVLEDERPAVLGTSFAGLSKGYRFSVLTKESLLA